MLQLKVSFVVEIWSVASLDTCDYQEKNTKYYLLRL